MINWQPIETAPKDGTWVLLIDARCGIPNIKADQWEGVHWGGRWYNSQPTHWAPINLPGEETACETRDMKTYEEILDVVEARMTKRKEPFYAYAWAVNAEVFAEAMLRNGLSKSEVAEIMTTASDIILPNDSKEATT